MSLEAIIALVTFLVIIIGTVSGSLLAYLQLRRTPMTDVEAQRLVESALLRAAYVITCAMPDEISLTL